MIESTNTWRYYKHAMIPATPPHIQPDLQPIEDGRIWKMKRGGGTPYLVRWTSNWDCGYETEWWYLIKDENFSWEEMSAEQRKKLKKALKNIDVKRIAPQEYKSQIYRVYVNAFKRYKNAGKPMTMDIYEKSFIENENVYWWGGFIKDTDYLIGWAQDYIFNDYVNFSVSKYDPQYLKLRVAEAITYAQLNHYINVMKKLYVLNGSRCINHVTNIQDFYIEHFNFRKAYCELHILYRWDVKIIIRMLYPFLGLIEKIDHNGFVHEIVSILRMEKIRRSFITEGK